MIVACGALAAFANGSRGPFGADFWTAQRLVGRIAVGGMLGVALGGLLFASQYRMRELG